MTRPTDVVMLTEQLPDLGAGTEHFVGAEVPVLAKTADALESLRTDEDTVDAHRIAEVVSSDPLMTLKVLAFAGQHRGSRVVTDVETVIEALVMMASRRSSALSALSRRSRSGWRNIPRRWPRCWRRCALRTLVRIWRSPSRCSGWIPMLPPFTRSRCCGISRTEDARIRSTELAARLARHVTGGWSSAAVKADIQEISALLNLSVPATLQLAQEI